MAAYEEASVSLPESPHIAFNKGNALYRKEQYAEAQKCLEDAALKTRDVALESRAKFSIGNCAFREAQRQRDSDLKKALQACERSIGHYQDALKLDPGFQHAAENVEIVRLVMKTILDDIKKQEEAARQQQEQIKRAAEGLQELIDKQQALQDRNQAVSEQKGGQAAKDVAEKNKQLAKDQDDLQQETREAADGLPKAPNQPSPLDQAREHVKQAAREQGDATRELEKNNNASAAASQKKATDQLKEALEALTGGQKDQPQQGQPQTDQEQAQSPQSQDEEPSSDKAEQPQDQQAMLPLADEVRDILDEEKENQERRRVRQVGGHRGVDRDW